MVLELQPFLLYGTCTCKNFSSGFRGCEDFNGAPHTPQIPNRTEITSHMEVRES